jgi:osmotically-inducible protein OsmY
MIGVLVFVAVGGSCRRQESPPPPPRPVAGIPKTRLESNRFQGTPQAHWPDEAIGHAVEAAVRAQLGSDAARKLEVTVNHGIVLLSGGADTLVARDAAVAAAGSVRGVRSVVDEIVVNVPRRPDEEIAEDVRRAIRSRDADWTRRIDASVSRGAVTLTGTVESGQSKRLASRLAEGVRGVRLVRNDVAVEPVVVRPDPEIIQDIRSRLKWSLPLDARLIIVTSARGKVILSGQVATPADRERAADLAWVTGVRHVDAAPLAVDPRDFPSEPRPPVVPGASDASISKAVRDALFYDPRLAPAEIGVDVHDGVVTLRGHPYRLDAKRAAVEDARATAGVLRVEDRMEVRPPSRVSDSELTRQVERALANDPVLDLSGLSVTVAGGTAMLRGRVSSKLAHSRAVEIASAVPGVRDVGDGILIAEQPRQGRSTARPPRR